MGENDRAVAHIFQYLEELQASRPSTVLTATRSPKGAKTVSQILAAARAIFERDGHAGLSLRKIADEAGIAVGNVSYYFETKRELLEAMLREALADYIQQHIEQFEADRDSPLEILLNVVEFYVRNSWTSHRFFYQLWGYAGCDAEAKELIRELYRPIGLFILYLVRAANPSLSHPEARQIVLQIFSLEEGLKLFIGMGPEDDIALLAAQRDIRVVTKKLLGAA